MYSFPLSSFSVPSSLLNRKPSFSPYLSSPSTKTTGFSHPISLTKPCRITAKKQDDSLIRRTFIDHYDLRIIKSFSKALVEISNNFHISKSFVGISGHPDNKQTWPILEALAEMLSMEVSVSLEEKEIGIDFIIKKQEVLNGEAFLVVCSVEDYQKVDEIRQKYVKGGFEDVVLIIINKFPVPGLGYFDSRDGKKRNQLDNVNISVFSKAMKEFSQKAWKKGYLSWKEFEMGMYEINGGHLALIPEHWFFYDIWVDAVIRSS